MESVSLESPSTPGGFRDFIALGTGFDFAEDRASRGNVRGAYMIKSLLIFQVYIFEIVETVGEPGGVGAGWRMKLRCKDPARFPVSALANITGYLLHSNGPKVSLRSSRS